MTRSTLTLAPETRRPYEQIMNDGHAFTLAGTALVALPSGALWLPKDRFLCVSDLHLGKSDRVARRQGVMLPPYETRATLDRLDALVAALKPTAVCCLGDSFDDLDAANSLDEVEKMQLAQLQAGRDWIWIEGNHDPGPVEFAGQHLAEITVAGLTFRHIATTSAAGEVSGHYHPKCRVRGGTRPAFLIDAARVILPAFGAFTGGLRASHPDLQRLMQPNAIAVLTGKRALPVPLALTG